MNLRLNSQSSFFSSLVTRWASLALPLAFSVVTGWSGPARASVVVWETGPFCDGCTLTNITFVSVEQFDVYTNSLIQSIYRASLEAESISGLVASARSHVLYADERLESALDVNDDYSVEEYITLARQQLGTYGPSRFSVLRRLDDIEASSVEISSQLTNLRSDIESGAGETRALVATACESDGECCCQCPDYTTYLQTIIASLSSIDTTAQEIADVSTFIFNELFDYYQDFSMFGFGTWQYWFYQGVLGALRAGDDDLYSAADMWGFDSTVLLTNAWSLSTSLRGPLRQSNPFTRTFDSASDPVAYWLLDIGTLWQQLLYDGPVDPSGNVSGPVSGWRDFALTKNNHPTNTADNPLWVRFNDSDSDVLSVSVDGFGNDFYTALSNLFSRLEIQVNNSLSQPSLHVTIDNTNALTIVESPGRLYENVVNNSTTINNIASEVTGQQAEYEDPDWTLDDYGSLFDKSAEMRDWDFVGKWADMFDDVTIEPPGPCKLWDGFAPNSGNDSGTPGPWGGWSQMIDIPSLYWYPMESCGGLIRSIRGVFRALWTIVILFVIAGLVRINWLLARCGVRILIAVVAAFGSPDPMGAVVEVFETVLKALSQLYTGLFGGRPAESD